MKEVSYVMIKPEFANYPEVITEVEKRLTTAGLTIEEKGQIRYSEESAKKHYVAHVGKDFYPELEKYITSDVAYGMVVSGENAIAKIRELVGATKNPAEGTIRFDIPKQLGLELRITQNVIHASDCPESAKLEISIFHNILQSEKANEFIK
ncbi:MAG: nucleoside-diphosphate kinase [Clostridia bacterium]|nr:nucleoside-diphosphate kinase [Clostridia bacterium]